MIRCYVIFLRCCFKNYKSSVCSIFEILNYYHTIQLKVTYYQNNMWMKFLSSASKIEYWIVSQCQVTPCVNAIIQHFQEHSVTWPTVRQFILSYQSNKDVRKCIRMYSFMCCVFNRVWLKHSHFTIHMA